jgi:uncharacterized membrane protein
MTSFTAATEIDVDRPIADVWAVVADYERDPEWRDGVVGMSPSAPGPVRPGTTTAEELHMGGDVWRNRGVVDAVEPGRFFVWHTTEGAQAHGDRRLTPLADGRTRVFMSITVTEPALETLGDEVVDGLRDALQQAVTGDGARLHALLTGIAVSA